MQTVLLSVFFWSLLFAIITECLVICNKKNCAIICNIYIIDFIADYLTEITWFNIIVVSFSRIALFYKVLHVDAYERERFKI